MTYARANRRLFVVGLIAVVLAVWLIRLGRIISAYPTIIVGWHLLGRKKIRNASQGAMNF
jgi:hypothetical protein